MKVWEQFIGNLGLAIKAPTHFWNLLNFFLTLSCLVYKDTNLRLKAAGLLKYVDTRHLRFNVNCEQILQNIVMSLSMMTPGQMTYGEDT